MTRNRDFSGFCSSCDGPCVVRVVGTHATTATNPHSHTQTHAHTHMHMKKCVTHTPFLPPSLCQSIPPLSLSLSLSLSLTDTHTHTLSRGGERERANAPCMLSLFSYRKAIPPPAASQALQFIQVCSSSSLLCT